MTNVKQEQDTRRVFQYKYTKSVSKMLELRIADLDAFACHLETL